MRVTPPIVGTGLARHKGGARRLLRVGVAALMVRVFGNLRRPGCRDEGASRSLYRAHLCASCHAMHEFAGRPSALLTNYDQTLLALIAAEFAGGSPQPRRCTALPWRRVLVQPLPPELRRLLAAGNLALIDAKLRDDIDDDRGGGRGITARLLRWLLRGRVRRAYRTLQATGFDTELVATLPARQRSVECSPGPSLDELARPSAELLARIFAHVGERAAATQHAATLDRLGAAIGRAVYGFDALDDHDEDLRRGRFNAIAARARSRGHAAAVAEAERTVQLAVIEALQATAAVLPGERGSLVRQVLEHLGRRAQRAADRLRPGPSAAALRPAEAGDCDLPCDCDCDCGGADAASCEPGVCSSCDCLCCACDGERRRRRREQRRHG